MSNQIEYQYDSDDSIIERIQSRKKTINLSASKIGQALGVSPYGSSDEYIKQIRSKYNPRYQYEDEETRFIHSLSYNGQQYHKYILDQLKKCKESEELERLTNKAITYIYATEQDRYSTPKEKELVKRYLTNHYRKVFGTLNEDHVASLIANYGHVHKDTKTHSLLIKKNLYYTYNCTGKIDRIMEREDGTRVLIEIKNRTQPFRKKVQQHEKIQIQLYLQMVDLQEAILVEYYNKQMNFHHFKRDDIYYSRVLRPKLIHFVHRLEDYL